MPDSMMSEKRPAGNEKLTGIPRTPIKAADDGA
jgi:hypothetical protein